MVIEYDQNTLWGTIMMLGQWEGAVYKEGCYMGLISASITLGMKIACYAETGDFGVGGIRSKWFGHPFVYSLFVFVLGFILVFRSTIAYGRFWAGRSSISLMSSKWADASMQACLFDNADYKGSRVYKSAATSAAEGEAGTQVASDKHAWRTHFLSTMSLLHAAALADLMGEDIPAALYVHHPSLIAPQCVRADLGEHLNPPPCPSLCCHR